VLQAAETEFLRVMMNLCSNARDALSVDGPGSIKVILEKLDPARKLSKPLIGSKPQVPSALITVTDTGCGIQNEDFARIFEPFHTTKSYGTGLGLAVVSNVVTEAGGSIHIKSGSNGTAFQLAWPLAASPFGHKNGEDVSPEYMLQGAKILIVDDNPLLLDLIASEVGKTGAEVTAVSSPLQALQKLEAGASGWDAIILDYDMPEMNGAQLAARIRADLPLLPIILCSALYEIEIDVDQSLFDARVIKSAISRSLIQTLRRVLSSSKVEVA
jgi:CheY-like chemotaxis protein